MVHCKIEGCIHKAINCTITGGESLTRFLAFSVRSAFRYVLSYYVASMMAWLVSHSKDEVRMALK